LFILLHLFCCETGGAPHTAEEKAGHYFKAPAGLPLVQHAVLTLFELAAMGRFSHELLVDKACHAPADIFGVKERGYVREGWFADLVLVDPDKRHKVTRETLLSKCAWSPFEGQEYSASIDTTIINGQVVYRDGALTGAIAGQALQFDRAR
jgi:dihydroorotase